MKAQLHIGNYFELSKIFTDDKKQNKTKTKPINKTKEFDQHCLFLANR